jgi:hypothetical protein
VLICVEDNSLNIRGDRDMIEKLCCAILSVTQEVVRAPIRAHAHIEYFPGHYFLDERSWGLVVALGAEE